ncbi:MAG: hypothetical protein WC992_09010, partial [Acholeplasmataceae bacterium]
MDMDNARGGIVFGGGGGGGGSGTPAPEVQIEYSATGEAESWSDTYTAGDVYCRVSTDGGVTWSGAQRFRGEDGADGDPGADGADGADAPEVQIEYSATGEAESWSDTYTAGDVYCRVSTDGGVTWS